MSGVFSSRGLVAVVSAAVVCLMLAGCSRPDAGLVQVEGTVTCAGKPLPIGTVIFSPEESDAQGEARGTIDDHGRFRMTHDLHRRKTGIPAGRYRVAVFASQTVGSDPETQRHELLVPNRYMNPATSGLTVEVPKGRPAFSINFALEGDETK